MPKLYQYLIENIADIKDWFDKSRFDISSFKKVIVESIERVKLFDNLLDVLSENFIIKIRFFNEDYEFSVIKNEDGKFNINILTEKELPYENQAYETIEPWDTKNYNRFDRSEFKMRKYICKPIFCDKLNNSSVHSVQELLVFYRIYQQG